MADQGLKDAIAAANKNFMDCFNKGDVTVLSQLYTEDCKLMPPGMDVQVGREAAAAVFSEVMKAGAKSIILAIDEVGPLDYSDTAYERSHYTFLKDDGTIFDFGKYVVIWKKINETWFLYTDIFNSNNA